MASRVRMSDREGEGLKSPSPSFQIKRVGGWEHQTTQPHPYVAAAAPKVKGNAPFPCHRS